MTDPVLIAAFAGLAAGLGVAMPLGAIGVLILRESMVTGFSRGAAAAAGVAFVDLSYSAIAVGAGAVVAPLIRSWGVWPSVISGLVVIGLGAHQLLTSPGPGAAEAAVTAASIGSVMVRFVGLTAINPLTLIYFFALTGSLRLGAGGLQPAIAFVLGAGLASLAWQLALATFGASIGTVIPARVVRGLSWFASGLIIALGVVVVCVALR